MQDDCELARDSDASPFRRRMRALSAWHAQNVAAILRKARFTGRPAGLTELLPELVLEGVPTVAACLDGTLVDADDEASRDLAVVGVEETDHVVVAATSRGESRAGPLLAGTASRMMRTTVAKVTPIMIMCSPQRRLYRRGRCPLSSISSCSPFALHLPGYIGLPRGGA